MQDHFATLRELDRVVEQVEQDLPHPGHVAHHGVGNALVHGVGDVEAFLGRSGSDEAQARLDALAHVERNVLDRNLARLDLGEVQNIIDDGKERVPAVADDFRVLLLLSCELCVKEEAGHADDGVHRRADLVAHGGKECRLRLVCLFRGDARLLGLFGGGRKLRCPKLHALFQGAVEHDAIHRACSLVGDGCKQA